jgi:hypothetical protein
MAPAPALGRAINRVSLNAVPLRRHQIVLCQWIVLNPGLRIEIERPEVITLKPGLITD